VVFFLYNINTSACWGISVHLLFGNHFLNGGGFHFTPPNLKTFKSVVRRFYKIHLRVFFCYSYSMKLILGNCLEKMKDLEENSVDSIVTDPPYGISFMGKKWDYEVPSVELWEEAMRVLKPGGHLLSFAGSRTYHRMAVNIEDAGFEIRDQIMWVYGSGFPKSHNIGKSVDKLQGNERETSSSNVDCEWLNKGKKCEGHGDKNGRYGETIHATPDKGSSPYEGWGTALKPAHEPIVVARKPLSEKTIAKNVLEWGTGGINIDGCRVEVLDTKNGFRPNKANQQYTPTDSFGGGKITQQHAQGRFPANFILSYPENSYIIKGILTIEQKEKALKWIYENAKHTMPNMQDATVPKTL